MENKLTLKKDDMGGTVAVVVNVVETTSPLSAGELKDQIKQHAAVIVDLQKTLEAVESFEASGADTGEVSLPAEIQVPIVNQEALSIVTEEKPEDTPEQ